MNDEISIRIVYSDTHISSLDLTLVYRELVLNCDGKILDDCGNSDHFPTICVIGDKNNITLRNHNL